MGRVLPKPIVDVSNANWNNILKLTITDQSYYRRERWKNKFDKAFRQKEFAIIERIAPALIFGGFYKNTKFNHLEVHVSVVPFWDQDRSVAFSTYRDNLTATIKIQPNDFIHLSTDQKIDFFTGVAARIGLSVCLKYKLNPQLFDDLIKRYPIAFVTSSLIFTQPAPFPDPPADYDPVPLTNTELTFADKHNPRWIIKEPFDDWTLHQIGAETLSLEFDTSLGEDLLGQLLIAMYEAPKGSIHLQYGKFAAPMHTDVLGVLRHFKRISLDRFYSKKSLAKLPSELLKLELSDTEDKGIIEPSGLKHLQSLEYLGLEGAMVAIDRLPNLQTLRAVRLAKITTKNLQFLRGLPRLQSLGLHHCRIRDLSFIAHLEQLRFLSLHFVPSAEDLSFLQNLPNLEFTEIHALNNVREMPQMDNLHKLRRVSISAMKNLGDLSGLAAAPNLHELILSKTKHLNPAYMAALKGHSSLKALRTDNAAIEEYMRLPRADAGKTYRFRAL